MPIRMNRFYPALDDAYARGGMAEAERFLLQVTMTEGTDAPVLAAAYNELGSLYRGSSRFPLSLNAFQHALELTAVLSGPRSSQYATILNNMAGTHRLAGDQERAIEGFHQALRIYRDVGEDSPYLYASLYNNLSLSYRETGDLGEAIRCLEQALTLIEPLPDRRQELAITCNNLAALYHAAGDTPRAAVCLERVMREFDACPEEENVHYAAGLNSLASCLYTIGDYERALEAYEKSAQHTLTFFGPNVEYAITCQNMRFVHEKLGQRERAVQALRRALEVYETLLGPHHPRSENARADLTGLIGEGAV